MKRRAVEAPFDRELADLPAAARWRVWMARVEAVLFAAAEPAPRAALAAVVGEACPLEALIADIRAELAERPYEIVAAAGGWRLRTRPGFAPALRAAWRAGGSSGCPSGCPSGWGQDGGAAVQLTAADAALLAAVAYRQPVTRRELEDLLGRSVDADAVGRLRAAGLVAAGPRAARPGAPPTYVTTAGFLDQFGLESLADLPDLDDLAVLGLAGDRR